MTDFCLEKVLKLAEISGMNEQLREAVRYNYGRGSEEYYERHPLGSAPKKIRDEAALAWGWVYARQTINHYRRIKKQ